MTISKVTLHMVIPFEIAKQFVDHENLQLPPELGFKYGLGTVIEFNDCFYFEFKLLNLNGKDYNGEPIAGAPGFIITKADKKTNIITFGELAELKQQLS